MAIQVLSAIYGIPSAGTPAKPNVGVNVTAACQKILDTGQHDIYILYSTFGIPDPVPDVVKWFGMLYLEDGKTKTRFGVDGQVIHLHN